jgi:hypothetical protein
MNLPAARLPESAMPRQARACPDCAQAAPVDQSFSWRAMNSFTTSRALSVWGPGSATHS